MLDSDPVEQSTQPTIWSQINLSLIFNISSKTYRGTQIFFLLIVLGIFLGLNEFTRNSLSADVSSVLIEAKILKLISSIFVSTSVLWSIIHLLIIVFLGSLIESVRGTYNLLIFIIQTALISELLTLIIFLSLYYFTFDTYYLENKICGFDSIIGAFIMSFTEISPNSIVIPNLSILTFQYMPFLSVIIITILHLIGLLAVTQTCLIITGTYISWLLLRYFSTSLTNSSEKGNNTTEFELQYLFPPIFRFPVRQISSITYAIFKNVGCCETNIHQTNNNISNRNMGNNTDLNDLIIDLSNKHNTSEPQSDNDEFTKSVISHHASSGQDAKKRQEAKNLIEKRLQELQREFNQRIIDNSQTNIDNNNITDTNITKGDI